MKNFGVRIQENRGECVGQDARTGDRTRPLPPDLFIHTTVSMRLTGALVSNGVFSGLIWISDVIIAPIRFRYSSEIVHCSIDLSPNL